MKKVLPRSKYYFELLKIFPKGFVVTKVPDGGLVVSPRYGALVSYKKLIQIIKLFKAEDCVIYSNTGHDGSIDFVFTHCRTNIEFDWDEENENSILRRFRMWLGI